MCRPAEVGTVGLVMPTISRTGVEVRDAGRSHLPEVRRVLLGAYREYAAALPPAVVGRYLTDILDVQGRSRPGRPARPCSACTPPGS
jgi:hypothetical protein